MIIAIDGPSASGKSTTAKCVGERLGILHLDTGAMYRAVTLMCLQKKIHHADKKSMTLLARDIDISFDKRKQICLNGVNVEGLIRSHIVTSQVSKFSAVKIVREKMVERQREISKNIDCVIEGRDIGTVVFPNADYKFYLDASAEVRATRRMKEYLIKGEVVEYEDLVKKIKQRDFLDMNRDISPLSKSRDAIVIDTSDLTINEQIKIIINTVTNKK